MPAVVPNAQQSPSQLTLTGILPSGHYCSGWMGGWDTAGFSTLPEVASLVKRGSGCGTPLGRPGSADIPRGVFWASGPVALGPCQAWVSVCLLCSACIPPLTPGQTRSHWSASHMREALDLAVHGAQHREAIGLAPVQELAGPHCREEARCIPRCFSLTTTAGECCALRSASGGGLASSNR